MPKPPTRRRPRLLDTGILFLLAALGSSLALPAVVRAQSKTYTNGEDHTAALDTTGDISLTVNDSDSATQSGLVSGPGLLTKDGGGMLTLTQNNTYSGGTTIAAGTLQLGDGGATGSITGNVANDGTLVFDRSGDVTFGGAISGTGGLVNDGNILRFSAAQTYTGPTLINSGVLVLPTTVDFGLSASTVVTVAAGAKLDLAGRSQEIAGLAGAGIVYSFGLPGSTLTLAVADQQTHDFAGVIGYYADSESFSLTKSGAGTQILSGANTYTGTTTINGGTLQAAASGSLGATSAIAVNNAGTTLALNYGGASDYTEAQATALLAKTTFGEGTTLAFDTTHASGPATYGDALAMNAGFTKLGAGTLVLTGNNTYGGATVIAAGTLQIGDGGAEGALPVGTAITNHGTLVFDLSGPATYGGITGNGALIQQGGGTLTLNDANTYTGATFINAGTLQVGDGGTTGSLAPDSAITVHGTLAFNRSDLVTQGVDFASSLTGGGQLVQQGSGTLWLLGTNTLWGGAVVNNGTIKLGNGTDDATQQGAAGAIGATGVDGNPDLVIDPARNGSPGGAGGSAFVVNGGGTLDLSAQTTIAGGAGGAGGEGRGAIYSGRAQPGNGGSGGAGGNAIVVNGGTLSDLPAQSLVTGGAGGNGGDAALLAAPLASGQGGAAGTGGTGVLFLSASSWTSSGTVIGGAGGWGRRGSDAHPGGGGGAGVVFSAGGSLDNLGTISGGVGGLPGPQSSVGAGGTGKQAGYGGAGVAFFTSGSLTNGGTISGGLGGDGNSGTGYFGTGPGGDGGLGVAFAAGGSLTNSGVINGGHGGSGGDSLSGGTSTSPGATGGIGRSGVAFTASSSLTNSGTISGGNGGNGGNGVFYYAGRDGAAGSDGGKGGDGGSGVTFAAGGSLTNSGTISGGLGGVGGLGGTRGNPDEANGADGATGNAGYGVMFSGGAGTLTNQSGGIINGGVAMDNFANDVTLATGSTVNGDLNLNTHAGSTLTLTGGGSATYSQAVTGVTTFAGSLIKNGSGTWTLDQAFTYTGGTIVSAGTLNLANTAGSALGTGGVTVESGAFLTGTGSFTGALTLDAGGTLAPGNTPGLLTIGSGSVFNGTVAMQIGGRGRGTGYDAIDVGGAGELTFGGTLAVSLLDGFAPALGDSFDLFDYTTGAGAFDILDLPALTAGLSWDIGSLYTTGTLSISASAVPEPSTCTLVFGFCALAAGLIRRRRALNRV